MEDFKFIGTELLASELTQWILKLDKLKRINDIRYYGSRVFGTPRTDSDIDVFILMDEIDDEDDDEFSYGPLFSKTFKGYRIEFHPYIDFHDGFVPIELKNVRKEINK